ncbi:ricin-type beta-trefoil lectin domain protein [Streptomyces sp. TG1A-8]|nr:ricin-type beta-trefoil lectin domain protein [Streptomyces sp. TG1A-8]MDO0924699.1 ricin-type beta-trefoil lectin domain protein [Streptomyces sp. TG1A-8]
MAGPAPDGPPGAGPRPGAPTRKAAPTHGQTPHRSRPARRAVPRRRPAHRRPGPGRHRRRHGPGRQGKCLDVAGANSADGTAVQLYDCNGSAVQQWTVGGGGTVRALGKCLDVTGDATADSVRFVRRAQRHRRPVFPGDPRAPARRRPRPRSGRGRPRPGDAVPGPPPPHGCPSEPGRVRRRSLDT